MHARKLLSLAAAGLAALSVQAASAASLTVANGWAPKHVVSQQGVEAWMNCVSGMEAGIDFNYFPSGQIAKTKEMLDALNKGIADLSIIPMGYVTSKMPLNGVSLLPDLGSRASEITPAYSKAVRQGKLADEFAANGIVPVWVIVFPAYQLMSRGEPLRTKADFEGKVIRSSGGAMNLTVAAVGSSAAEIPSSDLYVSLERGTVDGGLSALASIPPYKLDEVIKAVSTNGEFGSFSLTFAMVADKWNALNDGQQAAMRDCGSKVEASFAAHLDGQSDRILADLKASGVTTYEFTAAELAWINGQLASVSTNWVSRLEDQSQPAAEVLASYRKLVKGQ